MSNMFVEPPEKQNAGQHTINRHTANRSGPRASILETIGGTPVVRLNNVGPGHVALFAKLEAFNPLGSVKDRLALAMIETAERSGALKPGQTVVEATSGNTGVGLAMVCAQKGYPLVIVMAENFSLERRKLLRFLGAKVILTPASERGTGMFRTAERLAEAHGWFFCRQFENEANAEFHAQTTAQEILSDFEQLGLDYWVTGFGTGGTLKGVAGELKQHRPNTRIVLAEPDNTQILASGVPQLRRPDGAAARSHPNARAHPIQGWSPDFIPKLAGDAQEAGLIDIFQPVSGADALQVAQDLARREGIFCGISGGATVAATIAIAEAAPGGSTILAMVPDTGERYLSTPLFDHIEVEMNEEEAAIAKSASALAAVAPSSSPQKEPAPPISEEALDLVKEVIRDANAPVVMFGFEWCEFCWTVRRLFDAAGVPFRSIDVDSAEYRKEDRGGDVLRALFSHTGMRTVPQVFIGGTLVGGANEVLAAAGDGSLGHRLKQLARPIDFTPVADPMDYLPKWVRRPSRATSSANAGA
ncbi:pyridoxal-phosphate dependent enzyme [Denitrobaculum tricleocarpae]|nr:pyridoxal-phosphate dependent enzyme [Denitrobaculum tricleocarpae]